MCARVRSRSWNLSPRFTAAPVLFAHVQRAFARRTINDYVGSIIVRFLLLGALKEQVRAAQRIYIHLRKT